MSDQPTFHIVLHQPEIPPNTGNVGRTCVAIGAKLWLVRPLGFQVDDRSLQRAGLDYWRHLQWEVVDDWDALLEKIGERTMWFFSSKASRVYWEADFQEGDALVFGRETAGLPEAIRLAAAERLLRIPVGPRVRSLNLASAVSAAAYEAVRQTGVSL